MADLKRMRAAKDNADRLARIARAVASCEHCRCKSLGKPVAGDGNPDARLIFVGEAPGKREAASGHAFQGRAGKFLRQALGDAGIDENEVLFFNALKYKRFPKVSTTSLFFPRDPEDRYVAHADQNAIREKMLDKTLADSYPASDPPSRLPNPSVDSMCLISEEDLPARCAA